MLRTLGADLVGMSTALEAIAARAAGLEVFGLSLVTNAAAGVTGEKLDADEVSPRARRRPAGSGEFLVRAHRAAAHERPGPGDRRGRPDRHVAARRAARARLGGAQPRRRPGGRRPARARSTSSPTSPTSPRWSTPPQGASAVVHLAGIAGESTWPAISHANIEGTYCALEAARRAGVRRVVLASSNHATGYTPRPDGGPAARGRRPAATGHLLRRRQGDDGGARLALRRPLRPRRRLPADRQRVRRADDDPAAVHLALPRRHRLAGRRRADARRRPASPSCGASRPTPATGGTSPPPARSATSRPTTPRSTPRR